MDIFAKNSMQTDNRISSPLLWQKSLGLLATKFLSDSESRFVMQNGQVNNFCLGFDAEDSVENYSQYAWASDTTCFIKVKDNYINIFRWDKDKIEKINAQDSSSFLNQLYKYIGGFTQPREKSVVPIVMNLFGKLRNASGESDGLSALKSLLYLLAISNNSSDLESLGLPSDIQSNLPSSFEAVYEGFQQKINNDSISAKLILRHASGRLFQEAHYQALISKQLDIFDLYSSDYKTIKNKELIGVHFTPAFITRSIVEEGLRNFNFESLSLIRILDPACGSGEFLKEALRQIIERHPEFNGRIELFGWDKSSTAVTVAKFSLNFEKSQYGEREIIINISEQDSLKNEWETYDLIFMNPPFVSWELLDKDTQDCVQANLGHYSINRPNLASPFFFKALKSLSDKGVIGCVLPNSIFDADSYKLLREYSLEEVDIKLIGKLGNLNLFYNAVVDAGIYVASKKTNENYPTILWADNSLNSTTDALRNLRIFQESPIIPKVEGNYSIYKTQLQTNKFPQSLSYQSFQLEIKLKELLLSNYLVFIKDIFEVKQGARTGANSTFIIDQAFFNMLDSKEQRYFRPAITNRAIKQGIVKAIDYLWFPYGTHKLKSETDLKREMPFFYKAKLQKVEAKLKSRPEVRENRYNWWELTRERSWQDSGPKLVSTEFGKAGSFAFEKSGVFVVERGYAWTLKKEILHNSEENINFAYLALFSSSFFNDLLALYSKQIAGGQYYLARKFVNNIPIPDLTSLSMTAHTTELIKFGIEISEGSLINQQEPLDILVKSIYKI